jgi:ParB family chromosome partitioning protein
MAKQALGRGLEALLGKKPSSGNTYPTPDTGTNSTLSTTGDTESILHIDIDQISPCSFQPRRKFDESAIAELADSISEHGIMQPLLVRRIDGGFELIAGERRMRAAKKAELAKVPVIIRNLEPQTILEWALIENLQREDLNPLEEALGYRRLVKEFDMKQEAVAKRIGKSRASVANSLRLLNLAEEIQNYIRDGILSVGHAKVILGLPQMDDQIVAARKIIRSRLNVRQSEEFVRAIQQSAPGAKRSKKSKAGTSGLQDTTVTKIESNLQEKLGTKVNLRYRAGKGTLEVKFFNDGDLERILNILGISAD